MGRYVTRDRYPCRGSRDGPGSNIPGVSQASDGHTRLMPARTVRPHMCSHTEEVVSVEVDLPGALLAEMDAYAATRGYSSPDGVVREALERRDDA